MLTSVLKINSIRTVALHIINIVAFKVDFNRISSFSGKLIAGSGILAQELKRAGYRIIDSENIVDFIKE